MFEQRLKEYRKSKGLLKYQFAEILGVSESFYNMIENGRKNPSKNFMIKLVAESKKPEEYWFYGIGEDEYIDTREDFKCIKKATEQIVDLGLIKDVDKLFNGNYEEGTLEELLITALKADIEYIIEKKKSNKVK